MDYNGLINGLYSFWNLIIGDLKEGVVFVFINFVFVIDEIEIKLIMVEEEVE